MTMPEAMISNVHVDWLEDSLTLKWEMSIQNGKLVWPHNTLEVRFYCDPFPTHYGNPEVLSAPFLDGQITSGKSVDTGFTIPFVQLVSAGGSMSSEVSHNAFQINREFADKHGGFFLLQFNLLDTSSLPDVPMGIARLRWGLYQNPWKATLPRFRVVFNHVDNGTSVKVHEETISPQKPTSVKPPDPLPDVPLVLTDAQKKREHSKTKLFISYKRGTDGVQRLMDDLRKHHYSMWFDRNDIHLGDSDWQVKIKAGIWDCAGVILCLTPSACQSKPIQYEVLTALAMGKPIFPIVLEPLDNWSDALTEIGLTPKQHTEDFTKFDQWEANFARLLRGLEGQRIIVTPQERRKDRSSGEYMQHQKYLAQVIEQVGRLHLAAINPDATDAEGAPLEAVYVDLPTSFALSLEIRDYEVIDWWIGEKADERRSRFNRTEKSEDYPPDRRTRPQAKGWHDETVFAALVDRYQLHLDERKQEAKAAKEKGERFYSEVEDGIHPAEIPLYAQQIAAACGRLVVKGKPGSGKSTLVKHLALCLAGADHQNWTRPATLEAIPGWTHGIVTPVYIELRAFVASKHFPASLTEMPNAAHLWNYIVSEILKDDLKAYATQLEYDLREGHALLVLDGLDEVPYPAGKGNLGKRQEQLKALARSLNDTYGKTRILIATRPYAYENWTLPGFTDIELATFENDERIQLARNLYRASGMEDDTAKTCADGLDAALASVDADLKDTPLFITLMATLYAKDEKEGLPTRKGALYRESVLLLLERWTKVKPNVPTLTELLGSSSWEDLLARLAEMAYLVHEQLGGNPGTPEIPQELLFSHLFKMQLNDPTVNAAGLLTYLSENAGILVSPGHKADEHVFHFAHRTFQEYLAALHIYAICKKDYLPVQKHIESRPQLWRIPCTLIDDVLVDEENSEDELWDYIDDVLPDDIPDTLAPDDPRCWSAWLAGQVIEDHAIYRGKLSRGDRAICDHLRNWLTKLLQTPQALQPVDRAGCGRALSLIGDERPGVGVDANGLPDLYKTWCSVPAGTFWMGSNKDKDPEASGDELPLHEETILYAFKAAKYPVTYQQFQAFVDAEDGFEQDMWWDGFPEKEEAYGTEYVVRAINEQRYKHTNHPRDSVSWYQAVAFTRWLTDKYQKAGIISDQEEIRLPTEREWEYVARGQKEDDKDALIYPYGYEFDATKANTNATGIGQTSAVGLFEDPTLPFGVQDMSGNVWEWCVTKPGREYPDGVEDNAVDASGDNRVVRGGSFDYSTHGSRCASRVNINPYGGFSDLGFRVVLCPKSL